MIDGAPKLRAPARDLGEERLGAGARGEIADGADMVEDQHVLGGSAVAADVDAIKLGQRLYYVEEPLPGAGGDAERRGDGVCIRASMTNQLSPLASPMKQT